MTTLNRLLNTQSQTKYATTTGTNMHKVLQFIRIPTKNTEKYPDIVNKIKSNPTLAAMFAPNYQTEVPIAGTINNKFISRRIDRLCINHNTQEITILDYKTDTNKQTFYIKYIAQINEYAELLHKLYPEYKIRGYILWTHDFSLENIPIKSIIPAC